MTRVKWLTFHPKTLEKRQQTNSNVKSHDGENKGGSGNRFNGRLVTLSTLVTAAGPT